MTVRHQKTVKTLLEAMPYIRRFWGRTMVVRYGGAAMRSPRLRDEFAADLVMLRLVGMRPIVVHGGRGASGKELVSLIDLHGGGGMALACDDGQMISDATNALERVALDCIPVVAAVSIDRDGVTHYLDPDDVAGMLAAAHKAEKLMILSDVGGLHENQGLDESVVSECDLAYLGALVAAGRVTDGMLPKVAAIRFALEAGVTSAHLIDARVEHATLLEILTDAGCGTKIVP